MKKHTTRAYLLGVLTTILIFGLVVPALAITGWNITVYPDVKIYIDDVKLNPKDANGNPVEAFIYNGTTYLPVRAISEALGKPVQWNESAWSVYIGSHNGSKSPVWLAQKDYFFSSFGSSSFDKTTTDNLGIEHTHSIEFGTQYTYDTDNIIYKLNGQYTCLTGQFYQQYWDRNKISSTTLTIYLDNEQVWKGDMSGGIDPVNINIDLTGATELKLKLSGYYARVALGDMKLWP